MSAWHKNKRLQAVLIKVGKEEPNRDSLSPVWHSYTDKERRQDSKYEYSEKKEAWNLPLVNEKESFKKDKCVGVISMVAPWAFETATAEENLGLEAQQMTRIWW